MAGNSDRVGRSFGLMVAGNAVSSYGSFLNLVALNLFALATTGSALSIGVFSLVRIGSSSLSGAAAGLLVGRFNRRLLMLGGDLSQAIALLVFTLLPTGGRSVLLYALAAVMGSCSTLSGVALRSSVPEIVGQENRVRANGLLVTGRSLAMTLGFASAGIVIAWAGYSAAFVVDAATFLVSATILALLPLRELAPTAVTSRRAVTSEEGAAEAAMARRTWWYERLKPTTLLRFGPTLLCLVGIRAMDNFGSASHQVGLPVYAEQIAPHGAAAFVGRFWAAWAIGCLLAHQLLSRVPRLADRAMGRAEKGGGARAFAIGTCLMSGFFILAFSGLPTLALPAVAVGAGVADGFTQIMYDSRLQVVPDEIRGKLLGMATMAETTALGTGTVICAALLDHMSALTVVTIAHGSTIMVSLLFLCFLWRFPSGGRWRHGPDERNRRAAHHPDQRPAPARSADVAGPGSPRQAGRGRRSSSRRTAPCRPWRGHAANVRPVPAGHSTPRPYGWPGWRAR